MSRPVALFFSSLWNNINGLYTPQHYFLTTQTDLKPANNLFIVSSLTNLAFIIDNLSHSHIIHVLLWPSAEIGKLTQTVLRNNQITGFATTTSQDKIYNICLRSIYFKLGQFELKLGQLANLSVCFFELDFLSTLFKMHSQFLVNLFFSAPVNTMAWLKWSLVKNSWQGFITRKSVIMKQFVTVLCS